MVEQFEQAYCLLIEDVLNNGELRGTRNAETISVFGRSLVVEMPIGKFPLLVGRKYFYKGVLGELAALLREPKHIDDFTKWGCNYWHKWAKPDGSINVDYGNAWFAGGQIAKLKDSLRNNRTDRRMIINGWRPENLHNLDLPCCHYSYQFYVRGDKYLDMTWTQRSVDVMVGLPADIILAYTWLVMVANEFGFVPGRVKMDFGDTHIYKSHIDNADAYLDQVESYPVHTATPVFVLNAQPGKNFLEFTPDDITILGYEPQPKLEFELHA